MQKGTKKQNAEKAYTKKTRLTYARDKEKWVAVWQCRAMYGKGGGVCKREWVERTERIRNGWSKRMVQTRLGRYRLQEKRWGFQ